MKKNRKILIIPDVHGRKFWRYADPYAEEGIDPQTAIYEFMDILDFYVAHPDKVVLLLGNHDMHYLSPHYLDLCACDRYDEEHAHMLHTLFTQGEPFQLAHEETFGSRHYLFTHAGVTLPWLKRNRHQIGKPDADHLNQLLKTDEGIATLAQAGLIRGGSYLTGSIIWADSDETALSRPLPNVCQVFGHTQQIDGTPIITDHYACLDCRSCFSLDSTGTFTQFQK